MRICVCAHRLSRLGLVARRAAIIGVLWVVLVVTGAAVAMRRYRLLYRGFTLGGVARTTRHGRRLGLMSLVALHAFTVSVLLHLLVATNATSSGLRS
jgi:hypothetical protein